MSLPFGVNLILHLPLFFSIRIFCGTSMDMDNTRDKFCFMRRKEKQYSKERVRQNKPQQLRKSFTVSYLHSNQSDNESSTKLHTYKFDNIRNIPYNGNRKQETRCTKINKDFKTVIEATDAFQTTSHNDFLSMLSLSSIPKSLITTYIENLHESILLLSEENQYLNIKHNIQYCNYMKNVLEENLRFGGLYPTPLLHYESHQQITKAQSRIKTGEKKYSFSKSNSRKDMHTFLPKHLSSSNVSFDSLNETLLTKAQHNVKYDIKPNPQLLPLFSFSEFPHISSDIKQLLTTVTILKAKNQDLKIKLNGLLPKYHIKNVPKKKISFPALSPPSVIPSHSQMDKHNAKQRITTDSNVSLFPELNSQRQINTFLPIHLSSSNEPFDSLDKSPAENVLDKRKRNLEGTTKQKNELNHLCVPPECTNIFAKKRRESSPNIKSDGEETLITDLALTNQNYRPLNTPLSSNSEVFATLNTQPQKNVPKEKIESLPEFKEICALNCSELRELSIEVLLRESDDSTSLNVDLELQPDSQRQTTCLRLKPKDLIVPEHSELTRDNLQKRIIEKRDIIVKEVLEMNSLDNVNHFKKTYNNSFP